MVDLDLVGPASFFPKTWDSIFVDSEPANPASFYSGDLGPVPFEDLVLYTASSRREALVILGGGKLLVL